MAKRRRNIGEILQQWGLISEQQLEDAVVIAKGSERRLGECLVDLGFVDEKDIAKALASQFDMEFIDLDQPGAIDKESMKLLPQELIRKFMVLPLSQENGRLKVVVHDPMDLELLDNLRFVKGCEIDTVLASRKQIKDFLDRSFSETRASIDAAIRSMSVDVREASIDARQSSIDIEGGGGVIKEAMQAPIVRLVNHLITEGVNSRASDIHVEPLANRVRLRYRIDGVCHQQPDIPKQTQGSVIARLKIMAGVKIEEKRVPQDGRIKLKVAGSVVDFRFSSCPAYHGESCVMRILRPEAARLGLERLGMRADTLATFQSVIRRPNGIFLVTGPTGSGKTTSLYSALNELNRPDKKIITAEDPVEYNFPGINQCQVNDAVGLKFDIILRAMLRQAPNIVLVGEIRDLEVATVAIQAALTGHLVFSTLHTNDAPSAITRLIDMGVKPFLVASSIQAVLAQRLVRILCDECKQPDPKPDPLKMKLCDLGPADIRGKTIYKENGCAACSNTGFKGRRGIYELMQLNSQIRDLAFKRAPVSQIRAAARAAGMRNLLGDGRLKILDGQTTPREIAKIAQVGGIVDATEEPETAAH